MYENDITGIIVDRSLKIHKRLGPGLLESVYEEILAYELSKANLGYKRQAPIPVIYENIRLDMGFRADLIVENKVIVELKSVEQIQAVHKKQVLTYLKLTGMRAGLLINFNVDLIRNGITRLVNNL